MSLTTSLLLLGLAVVIALVLHGWWSARRASPRAADSAPAPAEGTRVEPELGPVEPVVAPAAAEETAVTTPRRPEVRLDPLIDVLVPIALEAPVAGASLLLHLPAVRRAGAKPLHAEGREVASGEWEPPQLGRRYSEVQFGLQMANRSGALNEIEFSEFVQKVQAFADAIGGTPDFPDMLEVCARARELDSLASPLDLQLTLNLRSNAVAWSVAFIQQCAARHGFVPGALPGRLVVPGAGEGAPPVLTLSFDSQAALADDPQTAPVRLCVLSLDVPQTPEEADPFASWQHAAFALAEDMDATLVDDDGRELGAQAFATIGRDLQSLYRQLEALEVPAGSPSARRLFS